MAPARTLTVAVLAGGPISEHSVSLASGEMVGEGLLACGHEVLSVQIGTDGAWSVDGEAISITPGGGLLGADVVFGALHGPFGEDGTVQGVLETLGVAYVGSGVAASAVCADKVLFKELMSARGLPQVEHAGVRRERLERSPQEVLGELGRLGLPVFVKPANLGSSVGIAKVGASEQLEQALQEALAHGPLAIVEAMAHGVEVECGVLGSPHGETLTVSEPGEIRFAGDWYDFQAKYTPGGMELRMPAEISQSAAERVQRLAVEAFRHSGCEGLARVDFFVDGEHVLVNELNTMPGFTRMSVYAKLMAHAGIEYPQLVDRLCRLALERHGR